MRPALEKLFLKKRLNILGLMSGTSCDGLDIAWIDITGSGKDIRYSFKAGRSIPYSKMQRDTILDVINRSHHSLKDLSQLNFYLADLWSELISTFLGSEGLKNDTIDLIASHGQTIWHQPDAQFFQDRTIASTWQIGDPSALANKLNIPVVGDFRVADVAIGGQGAPLIPYFDWVHFSKFKKNMLVVNIGGISNMTFLPEDGDFAKVTAFDTGPGNMLIDQTVNHFFGKNFDRDAAHAMQGKSNALLLSYLKKHDSYPERKPPKSTGREYYGVEFLKPIFDYAHKHNIEPVDIVTTLTYYTALTIYQNYLSFIKPRSDIDLVAIGGGGSQNPLIMKYLAGLFNPLSISTVGEYGIDEDFKEAIGFAVLANETIRGLPSNVPGVTGASRPACLGKICLI